jgi:hypothetical protein
LAEEIVRERRLSILDDGEPFLSFEEGRVVSGGVVPAIAKPMQD